MTNVDLIVKITVKEYFDLDSFFNFASNIGKPTRFLFVC